MDGSINSIYQSPLATSDKHRLRKVIPAPRVKVSSARTHRRFLSSSSAPIPHSGPGRGHHTTRSKQVYRLRTSSALSRVRGQLLTGRQAGRPKRDETCQIWSSNPPIRLRVPCRRSSACTAGEGSVDGMLRFDPGSGAELKISKINQELVPVP